MDDYEEKRPGSKWLPVLLILLGVLLIAGAVYWQIRRPAPGRSAAPAEETFTQEDVPAPEIQRISLEDAIGAYQNKSAIFLDVRTPEVFKEGHIPGAINIPLADLDSRVQELDANRWIITYCS